ncbi:nascent polypeptide associated complex alpha subunit, putative [Theileria equi strain WA]|uniref:Nascent polypeptide associated complex alpha subunit, putative n=1 Tax=Theileria equi strain WA TaxID=1537102 RepID=L0B3A0_THEEQ|nr:nascent polypeptide associated complex alpha subunit, putative [Theileria equi strain WA]AFZ81701.1 nascent polypeptide associated complex alpha subunit, putative [Theileria equi strain WA]|eukprot:XP_004831367.1 nascent polypeptide associated complex alpha subunit, putative [Theileria equi strain WA]
MARSRTKARNPVMKVSDEESVSDASSIVDSDLEVDEKEDGKADAHGSGTKNKQSKNERKARKSMSKLGLKPVEGVTKIYIRKSKQVYFVVNKPDVFKLPNSDTYVIFGEAKIEDINGANQAEAAQRLSQLTSSIPTAADSDLAVPVTPDVPEAEAGDFTPSPADIELVIKQAGCTREQATQSLVKHKGNVIDSIMELSA